MRNIIYTLTALSQVYSFESNFFNELNFYASITDGVTAVSSISAGETVPIRTVESDVRIGLKNSYYITSCFSNSSGKKSRYDFNLLDRSVTNESVDNFNLSGSSVGLVKKSRRGIRIDSSLLSASFCKDFIDYSSCKKSFCIGPSVVYIWETWKPNTSAVFANIVDNSNNSSCWISTSTKDLGIGIEVFGNWFNRFNFIGIHPKFNLWLQIYNDSKTSGYQDYGLIRETADLKVGSLKINSISISRKKLCPIMSLSIPCSINLSESFEFIISSSFSFVRRVLKKDMDWEQMVNSQYKSITEEDKNIIGFKGEIIENKFTTSLSVGIACQKQ